MNTEFQYLGAAESVPDAFTPVYGIRYNSNGFQNPINWAKREKKLVRKGVPYDVVQQIRMMWDGSQIPAWIDDAFAANQELFTACKTSVGDKARGVKPTSFKVTIEPTVIRTSYSSSGYALGMWSPDRRQIQVVNIYPTPGWMRFAKDLLVWEIGNLFSHDCGVVAEDPDPKNTNGGRPYGWPCSGPRK